MMIDDASNTLLTEENGFRHTFEVEVEDISPDPNQPRKVFDDESLEQLAATMAEHGQLQPILVRRDPGARGRWIVVAGERRWRAACLNKWSKMLAIECDGDASVVSLLENLQRKDLNPVEEARGLSQLIQDKGWTQTQAADALGKSKGEISAALRILTLPDDLLAKVLTSELVISRNLLVELARIDDDEMREYLIGLAQDGTLTIRAIRTVREEGVPEPSAAPASETDGSDDEPGAEQARSAAKTSGKGRAITMKAIDRFVVGLRSSRESGRLLGEDAKERLRELKREIEDMLDER
ncbi:ParB/RepB/Spo0J family partition protein [Roseomonas genomospecies 6]|nr:ParB/RepB/Spo0J family partition protein [Roseomonas genomospecies 6]